MAFMSGRGFGRGPRRFILYSPQRRLRGRARRAVGVLDNGATGTLIPISDCRSPRGPHLGFAWLDLG